MYAITRKENVDREVVEMSFTREYQFIINYLLLLVIFVNMLLPFAWGNDPLLVSILADQWSLISWLWIFMFLGLAVLFLATLLVYFSKVDSKALDVFAIIGNIIFLFGYSALITL